MGKMEHSEPSEATTLDICGITQRYPVSRRTVKRWLDRGLPYFQEAPRRKIFVKVEDVEQFLQRRCKTQVDLNAMVDATVKELGNGNGRQ